MAYPDIPTHQNFTIRTFGSKPILGIEVSNYWGGESELGPIPKWAPLCVVAGPGATPRVLHVGMWDSGMYADVPIIGFAADEIDVGQRGICVMMGPASARIPVYAESTTNSNGALIVWDALGNMPKLEASYTSTDQGHIIGVCKEAITQTGSISVDAWLYAWRV